MTMERLPGQGPELLVQLTDAARMFRDDERTPVESTALGFLTVGNQLLKDIARQDRGASSVLTAPDINQYFNELTPDLRMQGITGISFVLLGSRMVAIATAQKDGWKPGWEDATYRSYFDQHITGTPFDRVPTNIKAGLPQLSDAAETDKLIKISKEGDPLHSYLHDLSKLPTIILAHLKQYGPTIMRGGMNTSYDLFMKTYNSITQDSHEPRLIQNPTFSEPAPHDVTDREAQRRKLAELDRLLGGL